MRHRVSAALVKRIGEELIKDPHTAFFEIVKNGYDADATLVEVTFSKTSNGGGRITLQDDGTGMSEQDIRGKWFRPGSENKLLEPFTPGFRRRRLGAKGIGRFSLAKLGTKVKVITREAGQRQLSFTLDFLEYTDNRDLEDIETELTIGTPRKGFSKGTILEIRDLRDPWGKREIGRIRDQLALLIDPEVGDQNFRIRLNCPEWPELSGTLKSPLEGQESHRLSFSLDTAGEYKFELYGGDKLLDRKRETRAPLIAGPVRGVLRYYKEGVKARHRRVGGSKEETHMGVKVYRDSSLVRPYGEPGDDWLGVKAKRARAGGKYFVQPLCLAGSVYVSASDNPNLRDATNRESGMIQNDEFEQFSEFVVEQVDLFNRHLEQETKSEAHRRKKQTVVKILNTVVQCLSEENSDAYRRATERLDRSRRGEVGQSSRSHIQVVNDVKVLTKEEWQCNDCDERWRVLKKGEAPTRCLEFAVNRKGARRQAKGCGSSNIQRAKHERHGRERDLSSIVAGEYALVGGSLLRVRVDYEMGENEDEFIVGEREIVINGNHPAYQLAERLDGISRRNYEIGDDVYVPALTVHITKCTCLAWGELHYEETKDWLEFKSRYDELQERICQRVGEELGLG